MNFSVHSPPKILLIPHCWVLLRAQTQEQGSRVPTLAQVLASRVNLDKLPNLMPQFPRLYLLHWFAGRIK